eukprot:CAMPEP_0172360912 /NCGR_PEP_ID=MMETSP1060-20121228/4836_1 /TAXON_ID=37318 /ORGANISM="Pseudo-nitzschia pungens, Strain cf. cingulata" /LENGTH=227 /DNA_ID=CAMNT_0013083021 /DNA_START=93 /DNA_END=776 /DNA_ORIENTATION=+
MHKVYYYNFKFWRAEVLRAGLFLQGIPFDNVTDGEQLQAIKPKAPFGAFPIMELPDGKILSQTQAMAAYVGKLGSIFEHGKDDEFSIPPYSRLYPLDSDYLGQARCDEIINGCTDVTNTVAATMRLPDPEETKAKRLALLDPSTGRLVMHLSGLESLVCLDAEDFACGTNLTVADLCVWRLVGWLSEGILDHIPTDFVSSNFPKLHGLYTAVQENEHVIEYMKKYHD